MNPIIKTIGLAALVAIAGCSRVETQKEETHAPPSVVVMVGGEYRFEGNTLTEITSDRDNEASYAVISDIHGNVEKAKHFVERFAEMGLHGIIASGDIGENKNQIREVLEALAEPGLPVFAIPGNHETKADYEAGVREASKGNANIIDMAKYRRFDGDDADFVSLPGYQVQRFVHNNGYFASPEYIRETGRLRENLDDAVVLITHGAGYTGAMPGPATLYNGTDVGDRETARMMVDNDIAFAVCGHIHEAGGIAATFEGRNVQPGEWAEQFTANFGTLRRWKLLNGNTIGGMAGILYIKGNEAKYEVMVLE
ncbi:MAG: metallophosphoesterase family protein [Nanoarchaeota archaeon]|nr:metallophosphoesterase family protein [Nanoarchaeota archaeon]